MKQIKTVCIFRQFNGNVNIDIPINFTEEINIPFTVDRIEAMSSFLVGPQNHQANPISNIVRSNLIYNENLCVTSQLSISAKHRLKDDSFNGLYDFTILGPDNTPYLIPRPANPLQNPINVAYLILQIIFYE